MGKTGGAPFRSTFIDEQGTWFTGALAAALAAALMEKLIRAFSIGLQDHFTLVDYNLEDGAIIGLSVTKLVYLRVI